MNSEQYEELIDIEAANYSELNELQSNSSAVAFWVYVKKTIAFLAAYIDLMFAQHKSDINKLIDTTETGHIDWYLKMIQEFQYGDQLVIINNVPTYAVINESNQIVARVAYKEIDLGTGFKLSFKVVKEVSNEFVQLTTPELSALSVYVNRRKIPGTWLEVLSLPPDTFTIDCELKLDRLIFNDDGSLITSPTVFPFLDGLNSFLKNLDFGGVLYNSELTEYIMKIDGVIDFYINETSLNSVAYPRSVESTAGYIILNDSNIIDYVLS